MVQKYLRMLEGPRNNLVQDVRATNAGYRAAIAPLYLKVFNVDIPASAPDSAVPPDELKNLVDGNLYQDAWQKLVADATLEKSNYRQPARPGPQ